MPALPKTLLVFVLVSAWWLPACERMRARPPAHDPLAAELPARGAAAGFLAGSGDTATARSNPGQATSEANTIGTRAGGRLFGRAATVSGPVATALWRQPRSLDPFYQRVADDLRDGRPLIMAAYYGLWFDFNDDPDRNLNWNTYYGHARMMGRIHRDEHVKRNYEYRDWERVFEASSASDPLRTLVYHQRVEPDAAWQAQGVSEPFDAYLVMQAFASREDAAIHMTRTMRQSRDRTLELDDGVSLDIGAAQVAAYFGHNFFYDYEDFDWDGLREIPGVPSRPMGIAAVGCRTGRVPGFPELVGPNVMVLLYSRSLMASEGYSTLALADAVLRHLDSRATVDLANETYRYFHTIHHPDRRVGRPFVGHDHLLYE